MRAVRAGNGSVEVREVPAPSGRCEPCARGDEHICVRGDSVLYGIGRDGGMADKVVVPERCLVPLPAGVDVRDASLVEPLAVVVTRCGAQRYDRISASS